MTTTRHTIAAVLVAAATLCLAGPASASGTPHGITVLRGTAGDDLLVADAGANVVKAGHGDDLITPAAGADLVRAGQGSDYVDVTADGQRDAIRCGRGLDLVDYDGPIDPLDVIAPNCEIVSTGSISDPDPVSNPSSGS